MSKKVKIIIALASEFVFAMLMMSAAIYFGYSKAYSTNVDELTVRILGIPIYEVTKEGTGYSGKTMGIYMGVVCFVGMIFGIFVEEVVGIIRKKS